MSCLAHRESAGVDSPGGRWFNSTARRQNTTTVDLNVISKDVVRLHDVRRGAKLFSHFCCNRSSPLREGFFTWLNRFMTKRRSAYERRKPKIYPQFAEPTFKLGEQEFPTSFLFIEDAFGKSKIRRRRVKRVITQLNAEIIALADK